MAPQVPLALLTLMLAGHVMVGLSLSWTVTVNEQELSPEVNVFVVVPTENVDPDGRPAVCETAQTSLVGVA